MRILVCLASPARLTATEEAALAFASALPGAELSLAAAGDPGEGRAGLEQAAARTGAPARLVADAALGRGGPLGHALALAHVARAESAELVLLGAVADPEGLGILPAAIADTLERPCFGRVEELAASPAAGAVEVGLRSGGKRRRLRVTLPAVLGVGAGAGGRGPLPASPAAAGRPPAPPVEVRDLAAIGLDPALLPRSTEWLGRLVKRDAKPRALASLEELSRS